jgi:hypothetical protein
MPTRRRILFDALIPALLALVASCTAATPPATLSSDSDVTLGVLPGLEQRVTLTPAELTVGEDVLIHSVITNRGSQPVSLDSRICGLTLGGDLQLTIPPGIVTCAGFSMGGTIAPGESRESSELRRVSSPPGTYTLRVKHALRPEVWVELRVGVRAQ